MNMQIVSQAKNLTGFFFLLYFLPLALLLFVILASTTMDLPFGIFTRDLAATAEVNPLTGVTSNVGALLWAAAATICFLTWEVFRHQPKEKWFAVFMLCSGLLTTLLLCDDFFMLHDYIFPRYLAIKEKFFLLAYFSLMFCWMVVFRKCILKTQYLILLLAFVFFALSVLVDQFQTPIEAFIGDSRILFEDGFKLIGIVSWLGYFFKCCLLKINENILE
ncbi:MULTISPECIES: hypothetical protein [unclassified Shewanella]|uniref:hypothetical protein n=1 Tax=unclassified Shewanella TaxID=196818 RepID=UPI000C8512AD|nr:MULTISPECIES: hypothetical protein [unclassified Shewanella]MDO6617976.1 hypothetical protein [Shewanella sp. 6_MG-2023]MDO6639894.1 hypothetical protein [Shewanella sp. 5_MG-2023]MDO6678247.1 hypothetical protein [Shewanella sp. 4_MG-2023]